MSLGLALLKVWFIRS